MVACTKPGCSSPPKLAYVPRKPQASVLRQVIREHLPRLEEEAEDLESGKSQLPRFVVDELEAYVACGDPMQGALRLVCDACRHSVLVPFSCHGRSICPSCGARRMEDGTQHIVEHVLPDVPIRQWVLSLPFSLRPMVGYDADLFASVARIFLSESFRVLRAKGRRAGIARPLCGGIAFLQRASSSLALTPHVHAVVTAWSQTRICG